MHNRRNNRCFDSKNKYNNRNVNKIQYKYLAMLDWNRVGSMEFTAFWRQFKYTLKIKRINYEK